MTDVQLTENPATPVLPAGFSMSGVHCGIKRSRHDLALVRCDGDAVAAGVFTRNAVRAACVDRNESLLPRPIRAVVINSGNANAMTGPDVTRRNQQMAARVDERLGCSVDCDVLPVIGA